MNTQLATYETPSRILPVAVKHRKVLLMNKLCCKQEASLQRCLVHKSAMKLEFPLRLRQQNTVSLIKTLNIQILCWHYSDSTLIGTLSSLALKKARNLLSSIKPPQQPWLWKICLQDCLQLHSLCQHRDGQTGLLLPCRIGADQLLNQCFERVKEWEAPCPQKSQA